MKQSTTKVPIIHDDFLLQSPYAKILYHDHAKKMPIIDYHNHLSPEQLAKDVVFENITQAWLNGDHYKYRAQRTLGISEKYITGNAADTEKFLKWAQTVPYTMRNPLYHWTHMELASYFDINVPLTSGNASSVYEETSAKLKSKEFSARSLILPLR